MSDQYYHQQLTTPSGQKYTYLRRKDVTGPSTRERKGDPRPDPRTKELPEPINTQREIAYLVGREYRPLPTVPGEQRTPAEARKAFRWLGS